MNYYQAKQFLTVVKYMNLSAAAKELYITQPALSLAITRLEEELGLKLFYRNGNKLLLSESGKLLIADFKEFTNSYEKLLHCVDKIKYTNLEKRTIKLGFAGSTYMYTTFFMTSFLQEFEGKKVKKIAMDYDTVKDVIKKEEIDFAIVQDKISDEMIESVSLYKEEIVLVVSKKHPLAAKESINLKEIKNLELYGYEEDQFIRSLCDRICRREGFLPRYICSSNYKEAVEWRKKMAKTDQYCELVPLESFAYSFGKYGDDFVWIPIKNPAIFREVTLCWNRMSDVRYEYRNFIEHVKEGFPKQQKFYLAYIEFAETHM